MATKLDQEDRPVFASRSGNVCHYQEVVERQNRAVLAAWEKPPSGTDDEEAREFFRREAVRQQWVQDPDDLQFVPHANKGEQQQTVMNFLRSPSREPRTKRRG